MVNALARRRGAANRFVLIMIGSLAVVVGLSMLLFQPGPRSSGRGEHSESNNGDSTAQGDGELFLYCAAGMRYAVDEIVEQYKRDYGLVVQPEYQGSNTLLSQLEVSKTGDLYLAADESYVQLARDKNLVSESIPIAYMRPVIVVRRDSEKEINSVDDLLGDGIRVALGDPGAAAIGKKAKRLLSASGQWMKLEQQAKTHGVFKPTVNDIAISVELGSVDAGIVWDSTAKQYPQLRKIHVPELDAGTALIEIAVVSQSKNPTEALKFARYVAARDRGLRTFQKIGFDVIDGDAWDENPELTFFAGSVNRRALEPIIKDFEEREGVRVNTVYNGCGILTAQMRTIQSGKGNGFPDTYMACDVYYLDTVKELFQDAVNVSDTDVVIAVAPGNPKEIKSLEDLLRADVRVVLGDPERCTIGVLSRRLLQGQGVYHRLMKEKDVVLKATSALLVPDIVAKASDATLAYQTDTRAMAGQIETIPVSSHLSKAIQPYAVARGSDQKYLGRRLFEKISRSRDRFESAGFNWRLGNAAPQGSSEGSSAGATDNGG